MLGFAWLMGFGYACLLDNAACIYCFTLCACGAVISVLTRCFEGPLFRKATVQIFTTVLGFGLWLGLVGIVDIRNSGPKSLFHACFVCTLIFCFCFQIFMLNLKLNRNIYGDMIFCHSAFVLLHYLTACMLYSFNHGKDSSHCCTCFGCSRVHRSAGMFG